MKNLFKAIKSFLCGTKAKPAKPFAKYDAEQINKELDDEIKAIIREDLIQQAKTVPLCNLDGAPNPAWVKIFQFGFPKLTEAEILAKQQKLIAEELSVIEAFLNKELVVPGDDSWMDEIQPELKRDPLGYWHVLINNQWCAIADINRFNLKPRPPVC